MAHGFVDRNRLWARLNTAVAALGAPLPAPAFVVDLDAFDANAADLVRRAGGKPIRVASKSLRVQALLARALTIRGFSGVLAYSLAEALWLHEQGVSDDIVVAYPCVDRAALTRLVGSPSAAAAITLMADDVAHLDLVDSVRASRAVPVRLAIDVDAGLRMGRQHIGPKRSPLYDADQVLRLASTVARRAGFRLVGVMSYEGQVAGVPDDVPNQRAKSLVVRRLKSASMTQLGLRRRAICDVLASFDLEFWNAGGSGCVEATVADAVVTEVAAGSGLLGPACSTTIGPSRPDPPPTSGSRSYDGPHRGSRPSPAAGSSPRARSARTGLPSRGRLPGLHLTGLEGAGEVQTPLTGHPAGSAPDRRPRVVPARQVRRAVRARATRCTCSPATGSSTRCRPTAAPGMRSAERVLEQTMSAVRRRWVPAGC